MNVFDNNEIEVQRDKYAEEALERWGKTDAYRESDEKTKSYSKEKWEAINAGMNAIMDEFAICNASGFTPDSGEVQSLVKKWQDFITENHYTCTEEILAGLGNMYVADERFKSNIDKHGEGTAQFMCDAIKVYCK